MAALEIIALDPTSTDDVVADRQLFVDRDGLLVDAGSPYAHMQLASRAGKVVPPWLVRDYGLSVDADGRVVQATPVVVEAAAPEELTQQEAAVSAPDAPSDPVPVKEQKSGEDKQRKPGKTKAHAKE